MDVKEKKAEGLSRTFEVTISAEDLAKRLDAKIKELQPQVRLKGFRPGKVPASHIRKMFGKSIMGDIVQETVTETSQKAIADKEVRAAMQPEIDLKAEGEEVMNGKADLVYELKVETIPEFEPAEIDGLKFTRLVAEVSDEEIDEQLKEMASGQKTYKKKAKTAKAKEGDAVLIDFVGSIDGEKFEGGAAEGHQLVLGSNSFIPGFEDQLVGVKAGDEKDVTVTFPKDYQVDTLAGKEAVFAVTVHEVQGEKPAEVDDEFAAKFGLADLAALKEALRSQMEAQYEGQSRMKLKRAILDELDSKHDFDLPQKMVEGEFQQIWAQVQQEKEAGNLDEEDAAKSDEELEADYRKIAERRVRLGLVRAEIGTKQDVQITDQEIQQAVIAEARRYPGQEQEVVDFYNKNPQAVASLRAPIYEEKVVDLIIEKAEIKDKKVKKDKLFEDDDMI